MDAGLRITVLELPASSGNPGAVLDLVDRTLVEGPPTDLVLLPEQCLVGYVSPKADFDLTRYGEALDGPTATVCSELARAHGVTLVSPLVLRDGQACFNAMVAHDAGGNRVFHYEKRHPWIPETWATPGRTPLPVIAINGVNVTIAICYDGHFLSTEEADVLHRADLLLFPSAWVDREDSRTPLLEGLAREFDLFVANANWAEGVVRVPGQGGSFILDRRGVCVAKVAPGARRADAVIRGTRDATE